MHSAALIPRLGALRIRSDIERKLRRLDRVAHPDAEARVELIGNASHAADEAHIAEVTLVSNGTVVRSTSPGPTPLAAVDAVLDKLERQMVRDDEAGIDPSLPYEVEQLGHEAVHVGLAGLNRQPLVHDRAQRDLIGDSAVNARDG